MSKPNVSLWDAHGKEIDPESIFTFRPKNDAQARAGLQALFNSRQFLDWLEAAESASARYGARMAAEDMAQEATDERE